MSMIDWMKVAGAIRAGRLEDITSDEWEQVADKLVSLAPKKKGRIPNPGGPHFIHDEKTLEKEIEIMKKHDAILKGYDKLIKEGVKASQAKAQLADDFRIGFKSIERVLTIYRNCR